MKQPRAQPAKSFRPRRLVAACVLFAAATLAAPISRAQPVLDTVCGTTITADLVLDRDIDCTGYVGNAITIGADNVTIYGNGFRLLAPDSVRAISVSGGRFNAAIRDISVVGWCTGIGIYIDGGSGHVIDNVDATGRSTGADVRNAANVSIRHFTADSAAAAGLYLRNLTGTVALEDLTLTNNLIGLHLHTMATPLLLDTVAVTNIRGSDTGIYMELNVSNVTVDGLTLDGDNNGISANSATNNSNTFRNLNVSGRLGSGYGLLLSGTDHFVSDIIANRRNYGVYLTTVQNATLRHVQANRAITTAIVVAGITGTLDLRDLTATNSSNGLQISGWTPAPGTTVGAFDPLLNSGAITSLAGNDTSLSISNVQNITFQDLILDGITYGIIGNAAANANLAFNRLDVTPTYRTGTGIYLLGINHTFTNITAQRRVTGIYLSTPSGATLADIDASSCTTGIDLDIVTAVQTAPVLNRLKLTDNTTGLVIRAIAAPMDFGPANAIDVQRSLTGISVGGASANLTFHDLTFANPTTGISAGGNDHRFERIDFSGTSRGTGLALNGLRHVVDTVTANGRATGFLFSGTGNLTIANLTANQCSLGLYFYYFNGTLVPPTLANLDLRNNTQALNIYSFSPSWIIDGDVGIDMSDSHVGVSINYTSNLHLRNLVLNTVYRGIDAPTGNSSLTFTNLDTSAFGYSGGGGTYGILVNGPNMVLTNIQANFRSYGVSIGSASGAVITNLTARGARSQALVIGGVPDTAVAPVISNLDLRDSNGYGLYLWNFDTPMVIDETTGINVDGSATGIMLIGCSDITFRNLTLSNVTSIGINAYYANDRLLFENLSLRGNGAGTGLQLGYLSNNAGGAAYYAGQGHRVRNVDVSYRNIGLDLIAADGVEVTDLVANDCTTGMRIEQPSLTNPAIALPLLKNLDLRRNITGLGIIRLNATALAPYVFNKYDIATDTGIIANLDDCGTGVSISTSSYLTFRDFSIRNYRPNTANRGIYVSGSANITFRNLVLPAAGAGIYAYLGNTSLLFEDLDVSGPGYGNGLEIGLLSGNAAGAFYYGGPDHVIRNVTAKYRANGVLGVATSNLTIENLTATNNTSHGLSLEGHTVTPGFVPPAMSGLVLDNNGTGLRLFNFGGSVGAPWTLGPSAITSITGCLTSIYLQTMNDTRVHNLTLDGRTYGINSVGTGNGFVDLDVSGVGFGTGLRFVGANHIAERVTASLRDTGIFADITTNPTLRDVNVSRTITVGVQMTTTTLPATLQRLTLADNRIGLRMTTVAGTGSALLGPYSAATNPNGAIVTLAGSPTAISLTAAPDVTVDTAGLGLTQVGANYNPPAPTPPWPCGATIVSDLTLTSDLDCSGITATAITVGAANLTIDGGPSRFRIIAPQAATVILANARDAVTVKNLDISGTWVGGDGIWITGGIGHRITDVDASYRSRGAYVTAATDVAVASFTANSSNSAGLHILTVMPPLALTDLRLTDGTTWGLRLNNVDGDGLVLDATTLVDLRRSATAIFFEANVRNMVFRGPFTGLDGTAYGINATATTNANLTFSDLEVTPRWLGGTGLSLGGSGHTLSNLTGLYRSFAFDIRSAPSIVISGITASAASAEALRLENSHPVVLEKLELTRSATALSLRDLNIVGAPLDMGPWDSIAGTGAIVSLAENGTGIAISNVRNARFFDLTIDALTNGIAAQVSTNRNLAFTNIDVSGAWRLGTGMWLSGNDHVVEAVTSNNRLNGIITNLTTNLSMSDIRVNNAGTTALYIQNAMVPLVLNDLNLVNSATCLQIQNFAPDPSLAWTVTQYNGTSGAITALDGCGTGIHLTNVQNARFVDLTIPIAGAAINANIATNANLVFSNLDLSVNRAASTGLALSGTGHIVEDLVCARRTAGLFTNLLANSTLRRININGGAGIGLTLTTSTLPLTLTDISLDRNLTGLSINGLSGTPGTPFQIGPWSASLPSGTIRSLHDNDTSVLLNNVQYARFSDLALNGSAYGVSCSGATSNRDIEFDNIDVTPVRLGGSGLYLSGFNHKISNISSLFRSNAIYGATVGNFEASAITANSGGVGLYLYATPNTPAIYTPPTLSNLDLRNNSYGMYLQSWALPTVIDGTDGIDVRDSTYGIALGNLNANLTIRNFLQLNNPTAGLSSGYICPGLRLENLNASGNGVGFGVQLGGSTGTVLANITADYRTTGLDFSAMSAIQANNLTSRFSATGLYFQGLGTAGVPPAFSGLTIADNATGLYWYNNSVTATLDASIGLDIKRSVTAINASYSSNLTLQDLDLSESRSNGVYAYNTSNLTLRRLNADGQGRGYGLYLRGAGIVVDNVTAHNRAYGGVFSATPGAIVNNFSADGASTAAFHIDSLAAPAVPPTLSNLSLTNSAVGLQLQTLSTPMTVRGDMFAAIAGNLVQVNTLGTIYDLVFRDMVLRSNGNAINATDTNNRRIRFENVDTTGYCRGTGILLGGQDHTIVGSTASRRANGVFVTTGDRVTIADSVIGANTTGVVLNGGSMIVNMAVVADATNTATRFRVNNLSYVSTGLTLRVGMPGGDEDRVVTAISSPFVTLGTALSGIPAVGTTLRGLEFGDPRITVAASDICANGTGMSVGGSPIVATSNYWRSATGPKHVTNVGGTGDTLTGTATSFIPFMPVPTDKENPYCNQPPVADAGADVEVCEGDAVVLDASASYDPDIEPLSFVWLQRSGTSVTLTDSATVQASFQAPRPASGLAFDDLVFRVRADDGDLWRTDDVTVRTLRGNAFPTSAAGADQTVDEGASVALDGSGSFDPEAQTLTWSWTQVSGPAVTLVGADTRTPSFDSPLLDLGGASVSEAVVLQLSVTDVALPEDCGGPRTALDIVSVQLNNINTDPVAVADPGGEVLEDVTVVLDATASVDPDGDSLTWAWTQLSGASVALFGADTPTPTFTTPVAPPPGETTLVFEVTVEDGFGGQSATTVSFDVIIDECPDDPAKLVPGVCGCGVADVDSDNDGALDCNDACPNDPDKLLAGACGCGIADTDGDGDNTPDCLDGCPADPAKTAEGICGCGIAEIDSDGDATADCIDLCPADPAKVVPGDCGCGAAETDTDQDGVADCIDLCPADPLKAAPGQCGCGTADTDTDLDGVPDCLSDCAGLPDGTILRQSVPCGDGMCGNSTGTEYCQNGTFATTCDEAWEQIPDIVCGADQPTVAYAIASDANGNPVGTIRCTQNVDGVVTCDTDPGAPLPGTLKIYEGLFCPGEVVQ